MEIIVNGEARQVPDTYTAEQLTEALGLGDKRIAMEVNEGILPRSGYSTHGFAPGDRIEVVQAIGGG